MSDKVTAGHMDERFDEVKAELQQIHKKIDTNARAAEARFHVLESRLPGHSDDQIIELIDARLQAVLPDMLREAVTDGLVAPLSLVQDSINASQSNSVAIEALAETVETVKCDVSAVRASTTPIVEIADGIRFIRRSIVTIGITAAAMSGIWALVTQVVS